MGSIPRIFPAGAERNLTIVVSTAGARSPFSAYMTRDIPDVHVWIDDTPCFPLHLYPGGADRHESAAPSALFDDDATRGGDDRGHNVTDYSLGLYQALDPAIEKDDVFFYVYGILHSPDYRTAFAADLKKSLPRIPPVSTAEDFWAFANSGRSSPTSTPSTRPSTPGRFRARPAPASTRITQTPTAPSR